MQKQHVDRDLTPPSTEALDEGVQRDTPLSYGQEMEQQIELSRGRGHGQHWRSGAVEPLIAALKDENWGCGKLPPGHRERSGMHRRWAR
jgi:hypothetical protein